MDIRFFCGIGDILVMESHWPPAFRAEVGTIYVRPYQHIIVDAFRRCKATTHIRIRPVDYEDYDERASDWSEQIRFPQILRGDWPFCGSSLLGSPVASLDHLDLPAHYAVVYPASILNPQHVREQRDMTPAEWPTVLRWLEARGLVGVVLNGEGAEDPPRQLLNLSGRTTFAESVEIVKGSEGYVGIDGWMAVLAAQRLPADRLLIRAVSPWLRRHLRAFYAPHTSFPFIVDNFLPKLL